MTAQVLAEIEAYLDAVPRPVATTVECGPFTIFVPSPETAWPFYARPRLGLDADITAGDVDGLLARQTELGLRHNLEWVDEVTPSLMPAVIQSVGDRAGRYPLLRRPPGPPPVEQPGVVVMTPDHPDLATVEGVVGSAFSDLDEPRLGTLTAQPGLIAEGYLIMVAAYEDGTVVGGGTAAPRGSVAELMGIGVLPRARSRGLGTAITRALVRAATAAGVETLFLSAGSDGAASVYRAVAFEDVGTACILELDDG